MALAQDWADTDQEDIREALWLLWVLRYEPQAVDTTLRPPPMLSGRGGFEGSAIQILCQVSCASMSVAITTSRLPLTTNRTASITRHA